MREFINKTITFLSNYSSWNWMEIIQISGLIVSAYVAWIATRALNTWKQQLKAQKQTDFMDAITEAVHEFIRLMDDPIDKVKFVKSRIKLGIRPIENPKTSFSHGPLTTGIFER